MTWFHGGEWLVDVGWLLLLCVLLVYFWRDRQNLMQAQTWLKAKGYVTSCRWTRVGHNIWPKIEYTYQVYDKDLVGQYLFLDTTHNTPNSKYARRIAYKAAVAFKEAEAIDIYYNPNHPEQSALDVTLPKKLNVILILISALIVLQLGLIGWHCLH